MINIKLKNFRSFEEKEIELPSAGLVRISGDSGKGKSSILEAIVWSLFGDDVTRNVRPLGKTKTTCSSEVNFLNENLIIKRQKSPELLEFDQKEQLINESAQGAIESFLGMSYEQFMASSYVRQNMKGSLLTLSPAEMIRFIQKIAFGKEDPEIIKQKINTAIKKTESDLEVRQKNKEFAESVLDEKQKNISNIKEEILSLNSLFSEQDYKQTVDKLLDARNKLDSIKNEIIQVMNKKSNHEKNLSVLKNKQSLLDSLTNELTSLKPDPVLNQQPWPKMSREECELNKQKVEAHNHYFAKIEVGTSTLLELGYLEIGTESGLNSLNESIKKEQKIKEDTLAKLSELKVILKMSEKCSVGLSCPHCQKEVFLTDGVLNKHSYAKDVSSIKIEMSSLEDSVQKNDKNISRYKEICAKLKTADEMVKNAGEPPLKSIKDKEHLKTVSDKLNQYFQDNILLEQNIKQTKDYFNNKVKELNQKITVCKQDILALPEIDTTVDFDIKINELNFSLTQVQEVENSLKQQKSDLEIQREKFLKKKTLESTLQGQVKELDSLYDKVNELDKSIDCCTKRLSNLKKIKAMSDQAVSNSLNNIVYTINTNAKHYLDILFPDQGTTVSLSTTKINKDESVRAKMSVKVIHKGTEYNNIEELSGGEQSRVCLAYQLALSDLFNSRLLLLDEAFSGTQLELREDCIEALKSVSAKKLIVVLEHGISDAHFDEVVEI